MNGRANKAGRPTALTREQRLIDQAKEGDQSAFKALIFEYDRDILALALRLLGSREAAKDAYQETFLIKSSRNSFLNVYLLSGGDSILPMIRL